MVCSFARKLSVYDFELRVAFGVIEGCSYVVEEGVGKKGSVTNNFTKYTSDVTVLTGPVDLLDTFSLSSKLSQKVFESLVAVSQTATLPLVT